MTKKCYSISNKKIVCLDCNQDSLKILAQISMQFSKQLWYNFYRIFCITFAQILSRLFNAFRLELTSTIILRIHERSLRSEKLSKGCNSVGCSQTLSKEILNWPIPLALFLLHFSKLSKRKSRKVQSKNFVMVF